MIPSKLRISGFLSYQKLIEVDFDSFDLACISGSNGAGKSSILDAITWAVFGQARRTDEAIINNQSEQAEVGLDFIYEGETYRIQRSKQRNKSVVLDFFIFNKTNEWMPLTEATVRKTEEKIQETLRMDYEIFTNAAFFLQGKADQFATQKASDRKRILGSILGLDQWEGYKEKAANYRKELEKEETRYESTIDECEREIREEDERKSEMARLETELKEKNVFLEEKERNLRLIRDLKKSIEGLQSLVSQQEKQIITVKQDIEETQANIDKRKEEVEAFKDILVRSTEIEQGYADYRSVVAQLEMMDELALNFNRLNQTMQKIRMTVESSRTALQTELKNYEIQAKKIEQFSKDRLKVVEEMQGIQAQVNESAAESQKKPDLKVEEKELIEQQSNKIAENRQLKTAMDKLKEKIDQLRMTGATCPVCGQSWSEEDRQRHVNELEEEGGSKGDQYRANEAVIKIIQENLNQTREKLSVADQAEQKSQALQRHLSAVEQRLSSLNDELMDWEHKGKKDFEQTRKVLESQSFEPENQFALKQIESEMAGLGYNEETHNILRKQKTDLSDFDVQKRKLDTANAQNEPLSRELRNLEQQLEKKITQLNEIEPVYQKTQNELDETTRNLPDVEVEEAQFHIFQEERNRLQQDLGAAKQRVAVIKELRLQVEEYSKMLETTRREISRARQLETAFGTNGIPALLVEEAIPALEARANDLLDRLSSGNMSVRFDTQKELKSKDEKRETLDIVITDPAGTRPYEMFSGGEAFRVNFAIRLALSHLLTQRAGARLQTLVIDEGFGSQDSDGRQRLIEAINQVKSDFEKIIVITHLEEFKDAFPARIEVEKSLQGSTVKVICA